jgi:uncharacterized protein (TIGR02231 family)
MPDIEAPIVAVTVYPDRARVTRRGTVALTPGEHTLTLGSLPTTLQDDSVRAGGKGAGVKILGVEVASQYVTSAPESALAETQQRLQDLQDADRVLADSEAAVAARLDFLTNLRDTSSVSVAKAIAYGKTTLDNVASLGNYLIAELKAAHAEQRELAGKRRDLAREIAAVQAQLAQTGRGTTYERREIRVAVEAAAATSLELELIYGVTGAGWEPLYDIRLVDAAVTLTYLAGVRQQTGEDWPAVALTLSTARPAASHGLPKLDPWYVDVYRPAPPPVRAAMPMSMAAPSGGGRARDEAQATEGYAPPPPPPVEVAVATIESSGAALTYRVAHPVAVPADGAPHRTTVTALDLHADLDYLTVPKLATEAYLRATIRNTSPFTLLPGAANIFHGADFVGSTRLKTIVPNEEFEVQLGVDDRLKVERELTERATAKASLLGNNTRTVFAYRITLHNHLATPARVTVFDQVPVSRNEEIKPKLQEATPAPTEESDLHILKWELTLEPQAKQDLTFAFSVEHPRGWQIAGLNL